MCDRCAELEKQIDDLRGQVAHWMHVADQEATKSQNEWLAVVRRLRRRLKVSIAPAQPRQSP